MQPPFTRVQTEDLTINGAAGGGTVIRDGANAFGVLKTNGPVSGISANMTNLNITDGSTSGSGGGILALNTNLTLSNITFGNNNASSGGAISYNGGALTLQNVTLNDNHADLYVADLSAPDATWARSRPTC